ncbi:Eco57I restriction-modification methylase domain-containing protein [Staphylococcus succinus]|uniref:Eco57I restriction-modification methylase domain-containing protein n=1 Tax=Staphylococcus succinus TaxID=61015 RepID=UPI001D027F2A|nr:Eco57I restriction-modification methylase domain-containing protein [Staphylococcus succinus]
MKDKLSKLIELFEREKDSYIDSKNPLNEQNTRQQYIDVFLNLLGWDITNSKGLSFNEREIVAEEYSNEKDRPDYTIKYNGVTKFYIEAKKVSVPIYNDSEAAFQIKRYGWNSNHKIGVLTNFEYLLIYQTSNMPTKGEGSSVNRYKVYHYSEYLEKFDEIYMLLSLESVENGYFEEWTNEISPEKATKHSLDKVFLKQLNEWRIDIANDLLNSGKIIFKNEIYMNELVQNFLNQMIFLRFSEDNHFEDKNNLKELLKTSFDYIKFIKLLDKKYNAGIFKNSLVIENLSDRVLEKIIKNLYYPNVSYDFSVIELSLLSKVYEKFLQEELILNNERFVLEKTNYTKVKSVVSTPQEIVVFMVKKALDPIFKNLSPNQILQLRIADLAVGSGIFLIEVYNYIENYLIDWYSKEKNIAPDPYIVPFNIKKEIIQKVLYGFDINKQATDLTKFSLVLRILEYENKERIKNITPLLPSLNKNIIHGNSLVSSKDIKLSEVENEDIYIISPMKQGPLLSNKFDVIIGNPPYLNIEDMKNTTPIDEFNVYKSKFTTVNKQFDKYFLFAEISLKLIKNNGQVVLLIPNKFFNVGSAENLRKFIQQNNSINEIIDFGHHQIFDDVINYVSIVKFSDFNDSKFIYRNVKEINKRELETNKLQYDLSTLKNSHWFLTIDEQKLKLFNTSMKKFPNILNSINVFNGIQTSKTSVYYIPKNMIISEDSKFITFKKKIGKIERKFTVEKELLKELYAPGKKGSAKAYGLLKPNVFVIFPYISGKIIDESILKNKYPKTYEYLLSFKQELLPKSLGGKRDVKNGNSKNVIWYEYGRSQYLKESTEDKILGIVMSKESNFNIDRNKLFNASGGTAGVMGITLKENTKYSLEYILAWLNHAFVDDIFRTIGSDFEGGYYTHGTSLYKNIPLLPIDFENKKEAQYHNDIKLLVNKIESINKEIGVPENTHKIQIFEMKKEEMIEEINNIIDKLLILKKDEFNET